MTAAMHCEDGGKALELSIIQAKSLNIIPFKVSNSASEKYIEKAKADNSRNLLICSVAYELLQCCLLKPFQEVRKVQQG